METSDISWQGGHYETSCLFKVVPTARAVILCIINTLYNFRARTARGGSREPDEFEREPQPADHGDINPQGGAEPNGLTLLYICE